MIQDIIIKLEQKLDLSQAEIESAMDAIMQGKVDPEDIKKFLLALKEKGETIDEITGAAVIMRKHATKIDAGTGIILDTCGTGGDGAHTFNISTLSALVAAAAGCTVAKHGNRSVSSKCGSADLLKALGVNIEASKEIVEECLRKIGIGFLFAPGLHGAMKYAIGPRRELGVRTIFNVLGPLTNPALASHQLLGVFDNALTKPIAEVLEKLGSKHALVVHGADGLDEVTTTGKTSVAELDNGVVKTYEISPEDFGIALAKPEDLTGGEIEENKEIALAILKGEKGPKRDIVVLNAGFAIYAAEKAEDIKTGIKLATTMLDSGEALKKLEALIEVSNQK